MYNLKYLLPSDEGILQFLSYINEIWKIWDLIRPGIRENDLPYTKSTLDEREMNSDLYSFVIGCWIM